MPDTGNRNPGNTLPNPARQASNDPQAAEQNMRRALGLMGRFGAASGSAPGTAHGRSVPAVAQQRPEQARQRHRFVQDGGVPVVVVNHRPDETTALRERIGELESLLENERQAHAAARRALKEQADAAQALQTRLAHAELAHQDALANERRALLTAQEKLQELLARAKDAPRRAAVPTPADGAAAAEKKASRGRPRIHPAREQKPVRWWTPSYRAKAKA